MNKKQPTAQQLFQMAMPRITALKSRKDQEGLSQSEEYEFRKIKEVLFKKIKFFGFSLAHEMIGKYKYGSDLFTELESELYITFEDVLYKYDPDRVAPTTYFLRPFKGTISRFLSSRNGKTPYDIQNMKKINGAIRFYENLGIDWSVEMIANISELSYKVVKTNLDIQRRSELVDINQIYDIRAQNMTPEEILLEDEKEQHTYGLIKKILTDVEYKTLLSRLNQDDSKLRSFEKVAEHTGIPLPEVRKILNNAAFKLSHNEELASILHRKPEKYDTDNAFPFEEEDDPENLLKDFTDNSF